MKRLIIFLITLSLFAFEINPAYAASASLSLSPATGTLNKGCNFSIEVLLNTGGAPTDGTDAILLYDPTRFKALQINKGSIYSDYPGNSIDETNGRITVSGISSVATPFTGQGIFATIDFSVVDEAPDGASQIRFDFDPNNKTKTTDSNVVERDTVTDILSSVTNGNYIIGTGVCASGTELKPTVPAGGGYVPVGEKQPLPVSGDFETTIIIAGVGVTLTILAILGLVIL